MNYLLLKHIHIGCVVLTGLGFLTRSFWMLSGNSLLGHPWVKRLPHVVDTCLLGSAIGMLSILEFSLLKTPWLIGKLIGLLLYIGFGSMALKRGKTRLQRIAGLIGALSSYALIIVLAVWKPTGG